MSDPTPERIEELLEIVRANIAEWDAELHNYWDWEGLVEYDRILTLEEWEWCRDHFYLIKR